MGGHSLNGVDFCHFTRTHKIKQNAHPKDQIWPTVWTSTGVCSTHHANVYLNYDISHFKPYFYSDNKWLLSASSFLCNHRAQPLHSASHTYTQMNNNAKHRLLIIIHNKKEWFCQSQLHNKETKVSFAHTSFAACEWRKLWMMRLRCLVIYIYRQTDWGSSIIINWSPVEIMAWRALYACCTSAEVNTARHNGSLVARTLFTPFIFRAIFTFCA